MQLLANAEYVAVGLDPKLDKHVMAAIESLCYCHCCFRDFVSDSILTITVNLQWNPWLSSLHFNIHVDNDDKG